MKKVLAFVLSLALILGCVSFASAEQTTVRMLWWGSQARHDVTTAAVNKFMEKYPDIKVEVEYSDWSGYWSKLATQAAGNLLPDVIAMDYSYLNQYAANGLLADLTPYYESGAIDISNASEGILKSGYVNGIPYAIPTGSNCFALMYRADILEQAGLTMPEEITMEELNEMIKTVYEKTGRTANFPVGIDAIRMSARDHGSNLYVDDGSAVGFTADDVVRVWQMYMDNVNAGHTLGVGEATAATSFDDCVNDSWFTIHWTNELVACETGNGCDLKMIPYPNWSDATAASMYLKPSMFWSITETSQVKDAAAVLVNFFENDTDCFDIIGQDRAMPISSVIREHMKASMDENGQEVAALLDYVGQEGKNSPIFPAEPAANAEIGTIYTEYLEQFQYNMVDDLQAHAEAMIEEMNDLLASKAQ